MIERAATFALAARAKSAFHPRDGCPNIRVSRDDNDDNDDYRPGYTSRYTKTDRVIKGEERTVLYGEQPV